MCTGASMQMHSAKKSPPPLQIKRSKPDGNHQVQTCSPTTSGKST